MIAELPEGGTAGRVFWNSSLTHPAVLRLHRITSNT